MRCVVKHNQGHFKYRTPKEASPTYREDHAMFSENFTRQLSVSPPPFSNIGTEVSSENESHSASLLEVGESELT